MIGEFVSSCLLLVLGYAYPAFQCFKTVEKNRVQIPELRFWCQYWIIVAVITILEKIGDVFVSWVPMYGEMKLALFIYLWYPKTKGSGYIYDKLLRPYVSKRELDIDKSLIEFRERAWNLAIYYWHNCTELGSTKILQFLEFVSSSQGGRSTKSNSEKAAKQRPNAAERKRSKAEKWPEWGPSTSYRSQAPLSESIKVELRNESEFIRPEDVFLCDSDIMGGFKDKKSSFDGDVSKTKSRLRRFINGK